MRGENQEFETIPKLSKELGIGLETLREAAASGSFPVYKIGKRWRRVKRREVVAWVNSTRVLSNGTERDWNRHARTGRTSTQETT